MPTYASRITKHPDEIVRVAFDFAPWLASISDTADVFAVSHDNGIYVPGAAIAADVVTTTVAAGENGFPYLIACELTSTGGLRKRIEHLVKVKGRGVYQGPVVDGGMVDESDYFSDQVLDGGDPDSDTSELVPIDGGAP